MYFYFTFSLVPFCSMFNMCSFCVHFMFSGYSADIWRIFQKCSRDLQVFIFTFTAIFRHHEFLFYLRSSTNLFDIQHVFILCSFYVQGILGDVWRILQKCSRDLQGICFYFFGHILTSCIFTRERGTIESGPVCLSVCLSVNNFRTLSIPR